MENKDVLASGKYSLTVREASQYFSIGVKKMRRMVEDNIGDFAL